MLSFLGLKLSTWLLRTVGVTAYAYPPGESVGSGTCNARKSPAFLPCPGVSPEAYKLPHSCIVKMP
jgi:hypothetical protein